MDQCVLESYKIRYRTLPIRKLLEEDKQGTSMFTALNDINMNNVVYTSAEEWYDLPSTTLINSWNKLLRTTEDSACETCLKLQSLNVCLHKSTVIEKRRK